MLNEGQVLFGVSKEIITPCERTTIIGFGRAFGVPFRDIHDDLYAKALVLQDIEGTSIVLISMDLLFHDDSLTNRLREYVHINHNVKKENLHVNYSHTHYGPAVKGYDFCWNTETYEEFLYQRICSCIDRAYLNLRKGTLSYNVVNGDWNLSRRKMIDGVINFRPSPDGEVDGNIYLLKLEDEEGIMRVLAMSFACHPSNLADINAISAEYPGRLCQLIESEFYGTTALFFQGFGGDSKLRCASNDEVFVGITHEHMSKAAQDMKNRIKDSIQNQNWKQLSVKLSGKVFTVNLPLKINPKEDYQKEADSCAPYPGARYQKEKNSPENPMENNTKLRWAFCDYVVQNYDSLPEELPLNCGVIRLAKDFYILSVGGEPGINLQTVLRQSIPDKTLLCLGYNNAIAYIPSDKMISEGGYEAERSVSEYRLKGTIRPGVDKALCDGFRKYINILDGE